MESNPPKIVVIVGHTASGKTALAIDLAQRFNGEIIAADSRTVYKGMDIGTAKPSAEQLAIVKHHLIDVVNPDEGFSAADFQTQARQAIVDIASRGKLPIVVGGTGLYVDALIYDFDFKGGPPNKQLREDLELLSVGELQDILKSLHIDLPNNAENPRHLIRSIETGGNQGGRQPLRPNTLVLGLNLERPELELHVRRRVDDMVDAGLLAEVRDLAGRYGWKIPALQTPGYKEFRSYLADNISMQQAKEAVAHSHIGYAKRQKTWFRRNTDINWISKPDEAVDLVTTFLNKHI